MIEKGFTIPVLNHGHVIYVDHLGSDHDICAAARVSYNKSNVVKTPEDDQRLINRLYRDKHTSPFEMVKVVLNIKLPIFVERQRVRHRMQNMNEVSARYTELPDVFYVPNIWRLQDPKNKQGSDGVIDQILAFEFSKEVTEHCCNAYALYQRMIAAGVARELARIVLPLNIYTEVRCCWDMKNLLHFITLREDAHAQAEIQDYGRAIKAIVTELFPMTMAAYARYKFNLVDTEVSNG